MAINRVMRRGTMIRCPACHALYPDPDAKCPSCGHAPPFVGGFVAWSPDAARAGEHFDPVFFAELARYEDKSFWFRARNSLILAMLRKYAPDMTSFLEVGCGTGYVLRGVGSEFPKVRLVGTELFVEGLPFAAERCPDAELLQMDAREIPYQESFDVVSAFDVLEHIAEDQRVIEQMFGALKPGGLFMATVPQHMFLWSDRDRIAHHVRRYDRGQLDDRVRRAGFEPVRSTSFMSLLLPAMMAARRPVRSAPALDPMAEFKLPRWLDAAFRATLSVEEVAIRAGLSFPLGGSRLVVARRPAR
jgi:SAM-dependent methyltransferase